MAKDYLYRSIQHLLAAALLVVTLISAWGAGTGRAATTITVNSFQDKINTDGTCTLREAIIAANKDLATSGGPGECPAGSGADTIVLPAVINNVAGVYTLTRSDNGREDSSSTGDLDITSDVTLQGEGGKVVINTGSGFKDRVLHILSGNITIRNLTIQGGVPREDGGGIYNAAVLTIQGSTVSGNNATGNGGAIFNSGTLTLTNVTLSGNSATLSGGGLYTTTGPATLNNATVSANLADKDGNGSGDGGGVARLSGTVNLANTLIGGNNDGSAANRRQPDCSGSLSSQGYNLVQNVTGCNLSGTTTGNQTGVDPMLGPLADNGGPTPTHKLLAGSPAVDKGNPVSPGSSSSACATTDQRGVARPQGAACDTGAYEAEDLLQTGPTFTVISVVGTNEDRDDGACTFGHCSLREAIQATNSRPNTADLSIHFNLSGGNTINVGSALPEITSPVVIDGSSQPGGTLVLDGSGAGANVSGLTVSGGGSQLKGLTIQDFSCNGVLLASSGNTIDSNSITGNGCDGVRVASGANNWLTANRIWDNGQLGIDLGGDGPTANDTGDPDTGANNLQNYPVLFAADPFVVNGKTVVTWLLNGTANTPYQLEFFSNQTCDTSGFGESEVFLNSASVTTDSRGNAYLQTELASLPVDSFVSATATDPAGNTSELSACQRVDARNDSWPAALSLTLPQNGSKAMVDQPLDQQGQSRWYKFEIQPNSRLVVTLTNLPANYDLTLYKDIEQSYTTLTSDQDLVRLGAEFAADAFNADSFSSDAFNADAFSPQAFSPQAFSPQAFSPQAFSPQAFSPQAFSPQAFSPEAFLADAYSPQAFSPQAFSPQAFSPQAFSPQAFSPQAFSNSQTRSLIGVSAFDGTAGEGLILNTWDNTGNFYVRVRGRNGAFDPAVKFHLEITQIQGSCADVSTSLPGTSLTGESGGFRTLILTDFSRLPGSDEEKSMLQTKLAIFASRPEVQGMLVDVGTDARVAAANAEADRGDNFQCPFAKNQVAYAIKSVIDNYRDKNQGTLEYIVILGNDEVVPFFRHADQAMLANEKNYAPPVLDTNASQASLKLGYVLSQDRYGTSIEISHKDESFPIPDLAVGRLVENAADASRMLDAYLKTNNGVLPTPTSALVTGYDFLVDNAEAVRDDLAAGLGTSSAVDSLITPANLSPADPSDQVWTADDLRSELFGARHDLIYLAGHFSAGGALAADFSTSILSSELLNLPNNLLENSLIYSAGCHAGYNIVDPHGVPFVTREPDWAQAANSQGITLIAGTGYQYGDTDFIEYSERLYLEFTRQLRAGSGAVPIGKALVEAKQVYLAETPQLRGIHEKALLEATLFGFPMSAVNMPGQRYTPDGDDTLPVNLQGYNSNPGASLGLEFGDVTITPSLDRFDVPLKNVEDNSTVTATYFKGKNGVITNPVEPVLPAAVYDVSQTGTVLRGVGFREGSYTDLENILPLIGAATTEVRGVHSPFVTEFFFPVRFWAVNYLDALLDGPTRLVVTPAHFRLGTGSQDRGTLRKFDSLKFRLFYSDYGTASSDEDDSALSASPSIVQVAGIPAGEAVDFRMRVAGNPAAGIQEVWVTYTATQGSLAGRWQSLDLIQSDSDTTVWEGRLSLPGDVLPDQVRYVVQAVNGVGLVAFDTNQGAFHTPRFADPPTRPTSLALISPAAGGRYGTRVEFSAQLSGSDQSQFITFSLGPQSRRVLTSPDGRASATLSLLGIPGDYQVKVTFPGTAEYIASKAESDFTITKQSTSVLIEPDPATATQNEETGITATVTDATGRRLVEKTVFFVVEGSAGATSKAVITDYIGRARLGSLDLPAGAYTVTAYFGGENIPLRTNGTVTQVTYLDERYIPSSDSATLTLLPANNSPVCTSANAETVPPRYLENLAIAWPPNSQLVAVNVIGVTDPDGDPVTIHIDSIFQDEPTGSRPASPDGFGVGTSTAQVRAERNQNANGRMYYLTFTASDGKGGSCSAKVQVGVPPDQGGQTMPVGEGELYDSTQVR